jgi:lysophospholipase L1-like esterase
MKRNNLLFIIYVVTIIGLTAYFGIKIISGKFNTINIQVPFPQHVGFRGIENYSFEKPNNTFRIVAVGTSFTWGVRVNESDTYLKILENMLNQKNLGFHYEVLNLGIPGAFMPERVDAFIENATKYNPDLLIIQLSGSDSGNITRLKEIYYELVTEYLSEYPNKSEIEKILPEEEILNKAHLMYAKERQSESKNKRNEMDKELIEKPLKKVAAITVKDNISVMLLYIPDCPGSTYRWGEYIIEPFISQYKWLYLNLVELYSHYKKSDLILSVSPEDCHPNKFAHRLIAEEIYKKLTSEKLLPTSKGG